MMVAPPSLPPLPSAPAPISCSAILNELTGVSVWPLLLPVRGRLETILMVPVRLAPATALGDGAATADGEAAAAGDAAGLADGLAAAAAAGLAAAAAEGEAAAAGAAVGL